MRGSRSRIAKQFFPVLIVCLAVGLNSPSFALLIEFDPNPDPIVQTAFRHAADIWEYYLTDPVTVYLDLGFEPLDPGEVARASSGRCRADYVSIREYLRDDRISGYDETAVANLPGGPALEFFTNAPDGTPKPDNNGSENNSALGVSRANLKALGYSLPGPASQIDGKIVFNSDLMTDFDFDPIDGISNNKLDLVGAVMHEMGHVFGFVSGVDIVDESSGSGPEPKDLDDGPVFSVLDLYRYSSEDTLWWATGGDPYFSIDRGASRHGIYSYFSTGYYNGDGYQASHWKDDELLGLPEGTTVGIMDPSAEKGDSLPIHRADLCAFDVIGWDVNYPTPVSEPSTIGLLSLGILGGLSYNWRRRNKRES